MILRICRAESSQHSKRVSNTSEGKCLTDSELFSLTFITPSIFVFVELPLDDRVSNKLAVSDRHKGREIMKRERGAVRYILLDSCRLYMRFDSG